MQHYVKHRADCPDAVFETRALPPVDGLTRLLTMESWYWKKMELYINETSETIEGITQFCLDFAEYRVTKKPDRDFDNELCQAFMYFIYGGHFRRKKDRENIANDFWKAGC